MSLLVHNEYVHIPIVIVIGEGSSPANVQLMKWLTAYRTDFMETFVGAFLPEKKILHRDEIAWGSAGKDARYLGKLRRLLGKANEEDRKLILYMTQKMVRR